MQEKTYSVTQAAPLLPFLLEQIRGQSRNNIKGLLTRGQVQVDGVTITRHDHPLEPGQTVTIRPQGSRGAKAPFPILYEDGQILVIDKPAGLLSMASDREKVRTAYRLATDYVRGTAPKGRVFIVHRLDRDTSGVLLSPRTREPSGPTRTTGTPWSAAGAIWRWWRAAPPGRRTPSAPCCGRTPPTRCTPSAPAGRRR